MLRILLLAGLPIAAIYLAYVYRLHSRLAVPLAGERYTIAQRVEKYGPAVRKRLAPYFRKLGQSYPPKSIVLVGLKSERVVEVWIGNGRSGHKLLRTYPILGASGKLGPKLREGDRQVPEGLYSIELLNPNSLYHLSLRVNYPNEFDRTHAKADGRQNLGGDIMIHGSNASVGCLAMGDTAAEDLFVLAAETGLGNINVILSPVDFRVRKLPNNLPPLPPWSSELYDSVKKELKRLKPGSHSPQFFPNRSTRGVMAPGTQLFDM
jgi:hypothetical protein